MAYTGECRGQQTACETQQAASVPDPWRGRVGSMFCKTCIWFVPKYGITPIDSDAYHIGRCRRHAPTMNGYPVVYENDWCGDHKLDENKR